MSLWEKIVGIIETRWREKPRRDLLRMLVHLRVTMTACQESYEKYQALCEQDTYEDVMEHRRKVAKEVGTDYENPLADWQGSIQTLGYLIRELNPVLKIVDPKTFEDVSMYLCLDSGPFLISKHVFAEAANSLNEPSDFNFDPIKLEPTFKVALLRLDCFIKANFKIEEIYAVQSDPSLQRKFYY